MSNGELTPRQKAAKMGRLKRLMNTRYYISFNCKGSWLGGHRYIQYAWPVLFPTRDLAETALEILPIFANKEACPGRGRIVSATIERTIIRR